MALAIAVPATHSQNPATLSSQQQRSVADMRAFLGRVAPQSAADALRLLRNAYPEAPLSHRVAACGLG